MFTCFCERIPCNKQQCSPRALCHVTPTPRPPDVLKGWGGRLSTMATVASTLGSSLWGLDFKEANFRNFRYSATSGVSTLGLLHACDMLWRCWCCENHGNSGETLTAYHVCFLMFLVYPCHVCSWLCFYRGFPAAADRIICWAPKPLEQRLQWSFPRGGYEVGSCRWKEIRKLDEIGVCADDCRILQMLFCLQVLLISSSWFHKAKNHQGPDFWILVCTRHLGAWAFMNIRCACSGRPMTPTPNHDFLLASRICIHLAWSRAATCSTKTITYSHITAIVLYHHMQVFM